MKKLIWTGAKIYLIVNVAAGLHALWLYEVYSEKTILELANEMADDSNGMLEMALNAAKAGAKIRQNGDYALLHPRKFGELFRYYAKEES